MFDLLTAIYDEILRPGYRRADRTLRNVLLFLIAWPFVMATVSRWAPQFVTSIFAFGPLIALAWVLIYVVGPVIVGGAVVFSATRGLVIFVMALAAIESAIGIYFTIIPVYTWDVAPLALLVGATLFLMWPSAVFRTLGALSLLLIPLFVWLLFLMATTEEQRNAWLVFFSLWAQSLLPTTAVTIPPIDLSGLQGVPWLPWVFIIAAFLGLLWLLPLPIKVAALLLALTLGACYLQDRDAVGRWTEAQPSPDQAAYVAPQTREYNELIRKTKTGSLVEYNFSVFPGETVGFDVSITGQRWTLHKLSNSGETILTLWDHRWNMVYRGTMKRLNTNVHGSYLDIMLTQTGELGYYMLSIYKDIDPFTHDDRAGAG